VFDNLEKNIVTNLAYLYLLSPLHTGGTSQEGNLVGIAREAHTNFPYTPSSTIRGRLRANISTNSALDEIETRIRKVQLFGSELGDLKDVDFVEFYELETTRKLTQLEQGSIWIGDASILWFPVASLSHGVVWISCPLLLQRWARLQSSINLNMIPAPYKSHLTPLSDVYLKDAIVSRNTLKNWDEWESFIPDRQRTSIDQVIVLPNQHCETLIQMSLWRQVKVKLDEHKTVIDGSFRYEEAIPPDSLMYFPYGVTAQANSKAQEHLEDFQQLLAKSDILQIGGQESLGRGFVELWIKKQQVQQQEETA
jgi:CRISPR-associated protein Cmr4